MSPSLEFWLVSLISCNNTWKKEIIIMSAGTRGWEKLRFYHHNFIPTTCNWPGMWIILWQYSSRFTYAFCSLIYHLKNNVPLLMDFDINTEGERRKSSFISIGCEQYQAHCIRTLECAEGWSSAKSQLPFSLVTGSRRNGCWGTSNKLQCMVQEGAQQ